MATIDLGKIKIVWRGTYAGGTAYTVDDAVEHTDSGITSSFICTTASTGNAPSTGGSVHSSWAYLAKGAAGSVLTTQGDILFRDGSGDQRLAKGTAAQTLQMNSGATAPEWTTVTPPTSDFVLLNTQTITSSTAAVSFDGFYSATYNVYKMTLANVIPATDDVNLLVRYRASDADLTASNYYGFTTGTERYSGGHGAGNQASSTWADTSVPVTGAGMSVGNTAAYGGYSGVWHIYNPLSTVHYKNAWFSYSYVSYNATNNGGGANCLASYRGAAAHSGITFFFNSGNIATGVFKLYGLK